MFRPSIAIGVKANEGVDALGIREATDVALARAVTNLPDGFEAVVAIDFATLVGQQISSLQGNVLTGLVVVAIIALLLISWRASIITALFIVTVLAASVGGLYLVGISLNTISLFALILALGLFVDDAIVITEAIDAFRNDGEDDLTVIDRAISRVGTASISGTVTTVLVFAPMLLIGGILGGFIRILPITVILALVTSLLLSLIFIPVVSRFLLLRAPRANGPLNRAEAWLGRVISSLPGTRGGKGVAIAIGGFALSLVFFFVGVGVFAPRVGFNIFPPAKDSINIASRSPTRREPPSRRRRRWRSRSTRRPPMCWGRSSSSATSTSATPTPRSPSTTSPRSGIDRPCTNSSTRSIRSAKPAPTPECGSRRSRTVRPEVLFPFTMQVFGEDIATLTEAGQILRAGPGGPRTRARHRRGVQRHRDRPGLRRHRRPGGRSPVDRGQGPLRQRLGQQHHPRPPRSTSRPTTEPTSSPPWAWPPTRSDSTSASSPTTQESFSSLPIAFLVALLLMLAVLVVQFRSSVQWILVFLAIPFSFSACSAAC